MCICGGQFCDRINVIIILNCTKHKRENWKRKSASWNEIKKKGVVIYIFIYYRKCLNFSTLFLQRNLILSEESFERYRPFCRKETHERKPARDCSEREHSFVLLLPEAQSYKEKENRCYFLFFIVFYKKSFSSLADAIMAILWFLG